MVIVGIPCKIIKRTLGKGKHAWSKDVVASNSITKTKYLSYIYITC